MNGQGLRRIEHDTFDSRLSAEVVDFSNNHLTDGASVRAALLPLFSPPSNASMLDLRGNPLANASFENLTSLRTLWLDSTTTLELLPRALAGLPNLQAVNSHTPGVLNLSGLGLSQLPVPLFDDAPHAFHTVDLSHNNFSDAAAVAAALEPLFRVRAGQGGAVSLSLAWNPIERLRAGDLASLGRLGALDVSGERLVEIERGALNASGNALLSAVVLGSQPFAAPG